MDRVTDFESGGCAFDPRRGRQPLPGHPTAGCGSMEFHDELNLLQTLLSRLERVSVDSYWAHRASGVRGSLLRAAEALEAGKPVSPMTMQSAIEQGFRILERAAQERAH